MRKHQLAGSRSGRGGLSSGGSGSSKPAIQFSANILTAAATAAMAAETAEATSSDDSDSERKDDTEESTFTPDALQPVHDNDTDVVSSVPSSFSMGIKKPSSSITAMRPHKQGLIHARSKPVERMSLDRLAGNDEHSDDDDDDEGDCASSAQKHKRKRDAQESRFHRALRRAAEKSGNQQQSDSGNKEEYSVDESGFITLNNSRRKAESSTSASVLASKMTAQYSSSLNANNKTENEEANDSSDDEPEEEPTLNEYDDVPVDSFADALLMTMGWEEGKGLGREHQGPLIPKQTRARGFDTSHASNSSSSSSLAATQSTDEIMIQRTDRPIHKTLLRSNYGK
ncbi:hypothetical protein GQ42DRAFT_163146 [Ramicandelaber brevisporus]|nr:hypothetical protein GQ42DRAFT_163146 [Ramicandelaber brevisporus]